MNIHAGAFLTLGTKKSGKDRKYEKSKSSCQRNNQVGLHREERLLEKHPLERET